MNSSSNPFVSGIGRYMISVIAKGALRLQGPGGSTSEVKPWPDETQSAAVVRMPVRSALKTCIKSSVRGNDPDTEKQSEKGLLNYAGVLEHDRAAHNVTWMISEERQMSSHALAHLVKKVHSVQAMTLMIAVSGCDFAACWPQPPKTSPVNGKSL